MDYLPKVVKNGVVDSPHSCAVVPITMNSPADTMKSSIRDSTDKLYKKLSKIVAVANPKLGADWLQEVQYFTIPPLQYEHYMAYFCF